MNLNHCITSRPAAGLLRFAKALAISAALPATLASTVLLQPVAAGHASDAVQQIGSKTQNVKLGLNKSVVIDLASDAGRRQLETLMPYRGQRAASTFSASRSATPTFSSSAPRASRLLRLI